MATLACGDGERVVDFRDSTNRQIISRANGRSNPGRRGRKWKFRCIGSRSLLLILIWQLLISCSLSSMINRTLLMFQVKLQGIYVGSLITLAVISVSLTVVTLLSEVVISRYKLVSYSLMAMWLLSIVDCIFTMVQGFLSVGESTLFIIQTICLVAPEILLLGAYGIGTVPLGIDQIVAGSASNISSFVQWLLWTFFTGGALSANLGIVKDVYKVKESQINMILSLVPVLLLSVGLILDFLLSHKLVREPVTVNPVTLIFKVLKYAAKHKHPVRRSAFTYCENERPSRLDNGKSKYGGPFTTEQVEDVKTFWRILLVIFIIFMSFIPLEALSLVPRYEPQTFYQTTEPFHIIMICVPLYELLVYPCLRNRGPRILQSVGIGAAALIISSLYGLAVETVRYFHGNNTMQCLFTTNETCSIIYIPLNITVGFSIVVLCKSIIEFICAQAPYNMRGLLIGLSFTILVTFMVPGVVLYGVWEKWVRHMDSSRYGIWFYLTTLVLAVVSSLLLCCVVRRYKARERDGITNSQAMREATYIKYQEQEDENEALRKGTPQQEEEP